MAIFDDLEAEQDRLEEILAGLGDEQWAAPSAAAGWSVADVVLHLAQSEEAVVASVDGATLRPESGSGGTVDQIMDDLVTAQRAEPAVVFGRWREARRAAVAALRAADPGKPLSWVEAPMKPATMATTRLAEHWAHGLDITGPLGIAFPDTDRLRHVAWLGHGTLPYAFSLVGEPAHPIYCHLTGPGGESWEYGPDDADSSIIGLAGSFCRVGAQRLAPEDAALIASGPYGAAALRVLRNYAA